MQNFISSLLGNLRFFAICLAICAAFFLAAWGLERLVGGRRPAVSKARYTAVLGMCAAASAVLMLLEIPLFFAPSFYKLDFSEIPVLICSFVMGPLAGVLCEFLKILLKLILKGTTTVFVGDLGNFIVGCFFVLPASVLYYRKKTRRHAMLGLLVGTLSMTVLGSLLNAFYLIPQFAELFHLSLDSIIGMGQAVNPAIHDLSTLIFFAVVPFNLVKGVLISLITLLIYKPLRSLFLRS